MAIKVIRVVPSASRELSGMEWNDKILRRLADEMPRLQEVSHPRVLPIFGFASVEDHPAIVTEWCRNGEVMEYLNRSASYGADRKALVRTLMPILLILIHPDIQVRQVAEGLSYLHRRNTIHGDIKAVSPQFVY